jgi:hypothetical protein
VINWRSLKPSVAVHRLVKGGGEINSVQSAEVMAANGIGAELAFSELLHIEVCKLGKGTA